MTANVDSPPLLDSIRQLNSGVVQPLKQMFVGKDEIIDLLAVALVSRENLFLLGPPGTAKSALVRSLADKIDGRFFDYLLTKFTEPNELFGPFDIRRLREGELVTNTEGMLPEADFVFLDELLNANSSILNSLLMALNERVFRRGRETRALPALIFVGASNRLPEDESLNALFDRFLLRVRCDNVDDAQLPAVLQAGWALQRQSTTSATGISVASLRTMQLAIESIDLTDVASTYVETINKIRRAGIAISDRRAVKLQRPIAASALICGRSQASVMDLWILRQIWDIQEQQEVLAAIVDSAMNSATEAQRLLSHPQSQKNTPPNAEEIAHAIERFIAILSDDKGNTESTNERHFVRDQLSALTTRSQWITDETQREFLEEKCNSVWMLLRKMEET